MVLTVKNEVVCSIRQIRQDSFVVLDKLDRIARPHFAKKSCLSVKQVGTST